MKDRDKDSARVMAAARALEIREIDFFRLAFRRWYGREADEAAMDRSFGHYMMRGIIPVWVRQLVREVEDREARGILDPVELGVTDYRKSEPLVHPGLAFAAVIFVTAVLAYIILFGGW